MYDDRRQELTPQWADIYFEDGAHTGVRVLRGTTIIEVQRKGRKLLIDTATCKAIDQLEKTVYDG